MYPVRSRFGKWGDARLDEPANFGMPVETRAGDTAGEIESGVGCPSQEAKAFLAASTPDCLPRRECPIDPAPKCGYVAVPDGTGLAP